MKIQLLLIVFLLSITQIGFSQEVTISDEITLRSDQSYSIIGKFNEKTLLYRDKGTEFEVQAFNNELLGLSWTKELELDKKRPEVDKKKILLYHTEYYTKIEVSVFDLEKMEGVWEKEFSPRDLKFGADFYQMLVDNDGGMHMVLNRENDLKWII